MKGEYKVEQDKYKGGKRRREGLSMRDESLIAIGTGESSSASKGGAGGDDKLGPHQAE